MASKKRKREVDVELVKVYEELADQDETIRLKAAHTLVSQIFKPGVTTEDQTINILKRLFRGLCSGRKAARLGFSVALTELLSQISSTLTTPDDPNSNISSALVLDVLEAETAPEAGTSGQDGRDHYFGKVFGADAILKSGILFSHQDPTQWKRLLSLISALAIKKPWLRQECGWILYTCIAAQALPPVPEAFAIDVIDNLTSHKLIRTPEGVAIWIAANSTFPTANLPKSAWKYGDPLAKKDIQSLATILKDARANNADQDFEAQGSASWSANLHFAWDLVLNQIYSVESRISQDNTTGTNRQDRVSFQLFWTVTVEDSLFSESSSSERKSWGLNLWRRVMETAPRRLLRFTFTPNALRCLINSLKTPERLLQRCAKRLAQTFPARLAKDSKHDQNEANYGLTGTCLKALLESVGYGDFDQVTKTKTMQSILEISDEDFVKVASLALQSFLNISEDEEDSKSQTARQKTIISLQGKILTAIFRSAEKDATVASRASMAGMIFTSWFQAAYVSPAASSHQAEADRPPVLTPQAQDLVKSRLASGFEQALRLGQVGINLLAESLLSIHVLEEKGVQMTVQFEEDVAEDVRKAWSVVKKLHKSLHRGKGPDSGAPTLDTTHDGLLLLNCLILFQVYSGELEAVEIMRDLLVFQDRWNSRTKSSSKRKKTQSVEALTVGDDVAIIEILLGFAARPSKFLRRITHQVFESLAPQISKEGLEALCNVLEAKENMQGQREMFQTTDVEMGGEDSEEEELDSDVEVVSASSSEEQSSSDSGSSTGSEDTSSDTTSDSESEAEASEDDAELAAFDAALAAALGTRPLDQTDLAGADSDSDSDADMGDDEMMELDSKLAEVFRARSAENPKNKKKDAKNAKENIVHFKNRVLDLIDAYLKQQHHNALAIELILPLLLLIRTTQTKQVAEHAHTVLRGLLNKCKGPAAPDLTKPSESQRAIELLGLIHEEACLQASNMHASDASLSSVLVAKALVKTDSQHVKVVIDMYAATRLRQLTDKTCHVVPGFFTDWNNWCQSVEKKFAE